MLLFHRCRHSRCQQQPAPRQFCHCHQVRRLRRLIPLRRTGRPIDCWLSRPHPHPPCRPAFLLLPYLRPRHQADSRRPSPPLPPPVVLLLRLCPPMKNQLPPRPVLLLLRPRRLPFRHCSPGRRLLSFHHRTANAVVTKTMTLVSQTLLCCRQLSRIRRWCQS
jgi:hypothetical protein